MTMRRCPRCLQYYVTDYMVTDVVHTCHTAGSALRTEDVLVVGSWIDYTGSKAFDSSLVTPTANTLQFSPAWIVEHESTQPRTSHGNKKQVYRSRTHEEYTKFDD